jgi:hypothetical protein
LDTSHGNTQVGDYDPLSHMTFSWHYHQEESVTPGVDNESDTD